MKYNFSIVLWLKIIEKMYYWTVHYWENVAKHSMISDDNKYWVSMTPELLQMLHIICTHSSCGVVTVIMVSN